jgi:cytochrome P450
VFRPLLERLLGKSIVWAEGESLHGRMRNLLNPVFSAENVRSFQDDIVDIAQRLKSLLEAHIYQAEEANEKKVIIDSTEWSGKATADIIGKVGFGHDFGATDVEIPEEKKEDANDIAQLWLDQVNLGTTNAGFIVCSLIPFLLLVRHSRSDGFFSR